MSEKKAVKGHYIIVAVTVLLMMLFLLSGAAEAKETEGVIGLPNPFRDFASTEEAEATAGFPLEVPDYIANQGSWQRNAIGWWYQRADGSWPFQTWEWIEGKCYYFSSQGYCQLGGTTPDGYMVNAKGEWTKDGKDVCDSSKVDSTVYSVTMVQAIENDLMQVIYSDGNNSFMIRKSCGNEDISGDYNVYPSDAYTELNGMQVRLRGNGSKVCAATWYDGSYSYAIDANSDQDGLSKDFVVKIISQVR